MLENVVKATGGVPVQTGNINADYRNLRLFCERLLRVLERNTDIVNERLIQSEKGEI